MQTGFHHVAAEWAATRPESLPLGTKTLELHPELQEAGYEVKTIAGKAGDLLIWDYFREAHGLSRTLGCACATAAPVVHAPHAGVISRSC